MGRSLRKLKKGKPKVKVGVVKRKKDLKTKVPEDITEHQPHLQKRLKVSAGWDEHDTLITNYQRNKLVLDPNKGVGSKSETCPLKEPEERMKEDGETYDDDDDERMHAELRAGCNLPRKAGAAPPPRPTTQQRQLIQRLKEAHGDDLHAMMLDRKLNPMQHSEGRLRQLIEACQHWPENSRHDFHGPKKPYKKL